MMYRHAVAVSGFLDVSNTPHAPLPAGEIGQRVHDLTRAYRAHRHDATAYMPDKARQCLFTEDDCREIASDIVLGIETAGLSNWHNGQTGLQNIQTLLEHSTIIHVCSPEYTAVDKSHGQLRGIYARVPLYPDDRPSDVYIGQADDMFKRSQTHALSDSSYIGYKEVSEAVEIVTIVLCYLGEDGQVMSGKTFVAEQVHGDIFGAEAPDALQQSHDITGGRRTQWGILNCLGENILQQRGFVPYLARQSFGGGVGLMTLPPLCTNSYSMEDTVTHWLKRAFQTPDGQHIQYEKRANARDGNRTLRLRIAKAFGKKSNAEIAASPDATTLVAGTEVSIVLDLVPESQQHPHPCVQPAEIDVLRYPALRMLERLGICLYWQDSTGQTNRMWYSQPFESSTKPAFTVLQFLDIAEGLCQDPFQWPS